MPSADELYEDLIGPIEGKMVGTVTRIMRDHSARRRLVFVARASSP
jgi:hypothetical protein